MPLPEYLRNALAKRTGLGENEVRQLIDALEILGGAYQDDTSEDAKRAEAGVARWHDRIARGWDRLASLAAQRPAGAITGDPLDVRELQLRALRARADAELHRVKQRLRKNPSQRKRSRGADLHCRNLLARGVRKAVERHCPGMKPKDIRWIVVNVLKNVGATSPNHKKYVRQFDSMMHEPSEAAREQEQTAREQRLRDRSI
jgi:hypothetical protein